jgi:hypothetical protein
MNCRISILNELHHPRAKESDTWKFIKDEMDQQSSDEKHWRK